MRDGYGLQPAAIERLHADGVRLIVSVDCGIRAGDAARRARELGVDLIITDHHEPEGTLPDAFAVINPKRADCTYPDKYLAGVGVALKVVQALCDRAGKNKWLPAFVKIAAIGTLADVVPLVGENRVIAQPRSRVSDQGTARDRPPIAPRRLRTDGEDDRQLSHRFHARAARQCRRPHEHARHRRPPAARHRRRRWGRRPARSRSSCATRTRGASTRKPTSSHRRRRRSRPIPPSARTTFWSWVGSGWHRGVIGIAASKLVDTYHKPSIVLSIDGDIAHGSCRSIPDFDVLAALEHCSDLFVKFGGHKQAAGLTMEAARVPEFRARINAYADAVIEPEQLRPRLRIDGPLPLRTITQDLVQGLDMLGPFGLANPRPVFHASGVEIVDGPRMLKERHLKMTFAQDGRRFRAIAWRAAERADFLEKNRSAMNLAFSLDRNEFQGETYLELSVADFKAMDEQ